MRSRAEGSIPRRTPSWVSQNRREPHGIERMQYPQDSAQKRTIRTDDPASEWRRHWSTDEVSAATRRGIRSGWPYRAMKIHWSRTSFSSFRSTASSTAGSLGTELPAAPNQSRSGRRTPPMLRAALDPPPPITCKKATLNMRDGTDRHRARSSKLNHRLQGRP